MYRSVNYFIFISSALVCLGISFAQELNKLPNGDRYKGELIDGKRQGMGAMLYKNGDIAYGNYIDDRCDGFFLYTKKNGEQYYQVCDSAGTSKLVAISFKRVSWQPENPSPSKWFLTGYSTDAIDLIDTSSVRKQGNIATFWSLMNRKEISDSPRRGALSYISKTQIDCENSNIRLTYTYWYPERDGKGNYLYELDHIATKTEDGYWRPIPPTSDTVNMQNKACGK